jgi:hypothetical protein
MADDVGNGVNTIHGFNTAAPDVGGDLIDLRRSPARASNWPDSGDVLVLDGPAEEVLLARVEDVDEEAALADNILDGGGAGTEAAEVDLRFLYRMVTASASRATMRWLVVATRNRWRAR